MTSLTSKIARAATTLFIATQVLPIMHAGAPSLQAGLVVTSQAVEIMREGAARQQSGLKISDLRARQL